MFPEENFDLSRFTGSSRIILTALQRYGMFLVDEAGDGFVAISGATDSRWDDHDLDQLKTVPFSAFEVVRLPPVHRPWNASQRAVKCTAPPYRRRLGVSD